jgi:Uncharacterized protein conserved in bacteria
MSTSLSKRSRWPLLAAVASSLFCAPAAAQQTIPRELAIELRFVDALNEINMPDYAELVLREVKAKYPAAETHVKRREIEIILKQGKFEDAKKLVSAEKDKDSSAAWGMRLLMADYYFAYGQHIEALGICDELFKKYGDKPPAELAEFFADARYKHVQMLLMLGREKDALASYESLLKLGDLQHDMRRQAQFEYAELMVRISEAMPAGKPRDELLAKAEAACKAVLWEPDLWFGRGVVLLAHIEVIKGNVEAAQKLVKDYMPQLRDIDEQLKKQSEEMGVDITHLTPIAQCRFLTGVMLQDEADKLAKGAAPDKKKIYGLLVGALTEFVQVYGRYPATSWAPDAMVRADAVIELLKEEHNATDIQINITPEQRRQIAEKQFVNARTLYRQNQFANAVEAYIKVLNQFPDLVPQSIEAFAELVRSYAQLADNESLAVDKEYNELLAAAVIGHIAERFSQAGSSAMSNAGDALNGLASFYNEREQLAEKEYVQDLFFSKFTDHGLAAINLMVLAGQAYSAEDYAAAAIRYKTVMDHYPKATGYFDAIKLLADCYSKLGDTAAERAVREEFVKRVAAREKPGQDLISGMFMLERLKRAAAIDLLKSSTELFEAARKADLQPSPKGGAETNDMDVAIAGVSQANRTFFSVTNGYNRIIRILSNKTERAKYESNKEETDRNEQILEGSLYEIAHTLTIITQPARLLPQLKTDALEGYDKFLARFPKSAAVPGILLQMGTLWSTLPTDEEAVRTENIKKADSYFSRLAEEHPDSEQAKNAYFFRGKTLIELGYRREGVDVLKKMFSDSGKYTASQLLQAAENLLASGETELAREGFQLAIKGAGDQTAIKPPAEYGLAEIFFKEQKYVDAIEALELFVKNYPTSYKVIDANKLLASAAAAAAAKEPDAIKRTALFSRAVVAIRVQRQYLRDRPKDLALLELDVGKILEAQAEVAKNAKNQKDADKALGEAAAHYQNMVFSIDRRNAELLPILDSAYERVIALNLRMKKYTDGTPVYADVKKDCEDYLALFASSGRNVNAVRAALVEADSNLR